MDTSQRGWRRVAGGDVFGTENRERLARHVDGSSDERTVAFWDLDRRCGELKCGFVGRDAERHGNEGSHRLMAKWPSPRQLVAQRFTTAGSQIVGLKYVWLIAAWRTQLSRRRESECRGR